MAENRTKDNPNEIHTSLGQYFLIKKIAQGGMAEIYKGMASDIHGIQRTVVIKKILPHIAANKEFVDMLVSEAKIAVHLSHGNIAQIYDLGRAGTDYFMVMEYVDGRSLSQIHKRRLKLGELIPLEYILFIASEVANGLDYMHKRTDKAGRPLGIVHRDISPQNIIISYSGTVKIIDFGIAKAAFKVDDSESGILKGKFAYMSPEQARGEDIDSRSDIFSLGVILHELTSGRRLFKDKDNKATIRNVRKAEVQPPSTYNKDLPAELDTIVMRALAKDPDKRYQNASEFRDEIVKLLYRRFPDFNSADLTKFIAELFQDEIDGEDLEEEKENTPVLIVDQTQTAIHLNAPEVMKEFMLESSVSGASDGQDKGIQEQGEEPQAGPSFLERFKLGLKREIEWLLGFKKAAVRMLYGVFFIAVVAGVSYSGWRTGWWKAWSEYFRPVTTAPKEAVQKKSPTTFTTLDVSSTPAGASIFIDDREMSHKTPARITDFPADEKTHTIGMFLPGRRFFKTTFTAHENDTFHVSAQLQVAYGSIEIISSPDGATVTINGEQKGVTPYSDAEIAPDTVLNVKVEKEGFYPFETAVKINPDDLTSLRPTLVRLPKRPGQTTVPIPEIK